MLKFHSNAKNWSNILVLAFLIINALLIAQVLIDPSISGKIPWLILFLSVMLASVYWKAYYGEWPRSGLITVFTVMFGIVILYWGLILLPENELFTRLFKTILVILGGIVLLPLAYHLSRNYQFKHSDIEYQSLRANNSFGFDISRLQAIFLWFGFANLIFSLFVIPIFSRTDIIGWDTPTHIFRARLSESFGLSEYSKYMGGYQITFRLLSTAIHQFIGADYLDIVRILPTVMLVATSLAVGYFAFTLFSNRLFALATSLFTFAWVLSPWMVSNLFDNIMVTFFGILLLIVLSNSSGTKAWIFELFQILLLSLAGLSHLTLATIFFITVFHVNFMEFYDNYWQGERKNLLLQAWRAIRVPLISAVIVITIWFPALLDFFNSLSFGLQTNIERNVALDSTFSWIIKYYNLTLNLPSILLGYLFIVWSITHVGGSRSQRIVLAWSTVCIVFGIALHPISFVNSRFFIMAPMFILIPLGFYFILSKGNFKLLNSRGFIHKVLSTMTLGLILSVNLILNTYLVITGPGLSVEYYKKIEYVNHYIRSYHPLSSYIFLVEYTGPMPETYSDLWLRLIRSQIAEEGLVNSYLYFGTLDFLLKGEATPLVNNGLPELVYKEEFSNTSQIWFDLLEQDHVLDTPQITVFIIDSFNVDKFEDYEYLPEVDKIGPGILVINLPAESLLHGHKE